MASSPIRAVIGQAGGPTAVINQSLVGVVQGCLEAKGIDQVFGVLHGVQGILDDQLIDLTDEEPATLERVALTPGAALRSVRLRPDEEQAARVVRALDRHGVRYLFYIGGNDTAETALLLLQAARERKQELQVVHVPKTVDNDLAVTDHSPGYGSAARFVALAHMGDEQDNRSLLGVKVNVIMGRHAGWLTASAGLARESGESGPHLIYVPERDFVMDEFLSSVSDCMERHGRCVVALSEGIHDAQGALISESRELDNHGNVQLSGGGLGEHLIAQLRGALGAGIRARADTFGYLQRTFPGAISEVDAREAREVGRAAVEFAVAQGGVSGSVVIQREKGREYRVRYELAALEDLAQKTQVMPKRFLDGPHDVSPKFLEWLRPLVGDLPRFGTLGHYPIPPA
ncbi:MAG TPA: diphosphate--fructose-6-phosphate 1-phosphotransferase [Planctomycetes bacterium]|nr:diphosphate--fructose-6-phosphate 1-phosphotransferase [Planctomycetota bacterium]